MGPLKKLQVALAASPKMDVTNQEKWSARSQQDSLEIVRCRAAIERIDPFIRSCRQNIDRLESIKSVRVSHVAAGRAESHLGLSSTIESLRNERETLETYEKSKAELQAKIKSLEEPSEDQKRERQVRQQRIALLAEQRAKLDEQIAADVDGLRKLLNERRELTRSMRGECEAIDFTFAGDHLDEERFTELVKHLPTDLERHSRGWLNWFLGKWRGDLLCTVTGDIASISETLASPNVFLKGEKIVIPQDALPSVRHAVRW